MAEIAGIVLAGVQIASLADETFEVISTLWDVYRNDSSILQDVKSVTYQFRNAGKTIKLAKKALKSALKELPKCSKVTNYLQEEGTLDDIGSHAELLQERLQPLLMKLDRLAQAPKFWRLWRWVRSMKPNLEGMVPGLHSIQHALELTSSTVLLHINVETLASLKVSNDAASNRTIDMLEKQNKRLRREVKNLTQLVKEHAREVTIADNAEKDVLFCYTLAGIANLGDSMRHTGDVPDYSEASQSSQSMTSSPSTAWSSRMGDSTGRTTSLSGFMSQPEHSGRSPTIASRDDRTAPERPVENPTKSPQQTEILYLVEEYPVQIIEAGHLGPNITGEGSSKIQARVNGNMLGNIMPKAIADQLGLARKTIKGPMLIDSETGERQQITELVDKVYWWPEDPKTSGPLLMLKFWVYDDGSDAVLFGERFASEITKLGDQSDVN